MDKSELMLVLLVPIMTLFSVAILPLMPFIYSIKFSMSWLLVGGSFVLTVILLVRKKYSSGDIIKVLLGAIFSLAGFLFTIWTVFLWYNMAAILFQAVLSIVGVIISLILRRQKPTGEISLDSYDETESGYGTSTPRSVSSPGFLRVYREPIMYFVTLAIVGIIAMFIIRPIPAGNDILTNIVMGAGFGILGACCFIGSGRTKFERK